MQAFIKDSHTLLKLGYIERGLDVMFIGIDDMCWQGRFEEIDEIVHNSEVYPTQYVLGLLTITLCIKSKLSNRQEYFSKAEKRFSSLYGSERAKKMLQGLS